MFLWHQTDNANGEYKKVRGFKREQLFLLDSEYVFVFMKNFKKKKQNNHSKLRDQCNNYTSTRVTINMNMNVIGRLLSF